MMIDSSSEGETDDDSNQSEQSNDILNGTMLASNRKSMLPQSSSDKAFGTACIDVNDEISRSAEESKAKSNNNKKKKKKKSSKQI
jgi:hypothetical protein